MAAQTSVIHMARLPLRSKENNTPPNNTHSDPRGSHVKCWTSSGGEHRALRALSGSLAHRIRTDPEYRDHRCTRSGFPLRDKEVITECSKECVLYPLVPGSLSSGFALFALNSHRYGADVMRWLSSEEYLLLLPRTWVQFPASTPGRSQLPVTTIPEDKTLFWPPRIPTCMCVQKLTKVHTHTH